MRHADTTGAGAAWNPDRGAQQVPASGSAIEELTQRIVDRAVYVQADPGVASTIEDAIESRLSGWTQRQTGAAKVGAALAYRGRGGTAEPLLHTPVPGAWTEWSAPNSLRETEANVNLLIDTFDGSLATPPGFRMPDPGASTAGATAATAEDLDLNEDGEPVDAATAFATDGGGVS